MFDVLVGAVVIPFLIILITFTFAIKRKRQRNLLKKHPIPNQLGICFKGAIPILQSLDHSLSSSYLTRVKYRVKEQSQWADYEFDWVLFELKRYFIIANLLKSVPMFSSRVDNIWHEMLMFTKEYESFSVSFYNEFLHHIPNINHTPNPGEKAFFDWVYLCLFESTPNSSVIWGDFIQNPIKRDILDDFRKLSEEDVLSKYFSENDQWMDVKLRLIVKMKKEIKKADQVMLGKKKLAIPTSTQEQHYFQNVLGVFVYYSIYEDDRFQEKMFDWYTDAGSSCGSSCST